MEFKFYSEGLSQTLEAEIDVDVPIPKDPTLFVCLLPEGVKKHSLFKLLNANPKLDNKVSYDFVKSDPHKLYVIQYKRIGEVKGKIRSSFPNIARELEPGLLTLYIPMAHESNIDFNTRLETLKEAIGELKVSFKQILVSVSEEDRENLHASLGAQEVLTAKQLAQLLEEKLNTDSGFWLIGRDMKEWGKGGEELWLNKPYEFAFNDPNTNVAKFNLDDIIVIKKNAEGHLHGIFQVQEVLTRSVKALYLYELKQKITTEKLVSENELLGNSFSQRLAQEVIQLTKEEFKVIINSTEVSLEENREAFSKQERTSIDHDLAYSGNDLLDIENDVRSLALLLSSQEVKPPLAIALFGKWGSGKSFFMKHLQQRVKELSENQGFLSDPKNNTLSEARPIESNLFCTGIAQIEFNAWSYLDSDLWAGLVSSIFEKLNEYLNDSTKSGVAMMKVQEKLKERLNSLQAERTSAEERKEQLTALKTRYVLEQKKLAKPVLFKNFIKEEMGLSDETVKLFDTIVKDRHLADLSINLKMSEVLDEAGIKKSLSRNLKRGRSLVKYISPVLIGLLLVAGFNFLQVQVQIAWSNLVVPFLGSLGLVGWDINSVVSRFKKAKTFVGKYQEAFDRVADLDEKVADYHLRIKTSADEISSAENEISEIDRKIENFETYIEQELHNETIRDFVDTRANHDDYKDKLGIVSIIRKDFETLSELFQQSSNSTKVSREMMDDKELIQKQFKAGKGLERIILYIDDLDRCSDEKVLEVIQAVHLLMAYPLFNVVVGVDKRCVRNALLLKTKLQYRKIADLDEIEKLGIEMITPGEYLEKIFQIPFELKESEIESLQNLVDNILEGQIEHAEEEDLPSLEKKISDASGMKVAEGQEQETQKQDASGSIETDSEAIEVNNVAEETENNDENNSRDSLVTSIPDNLLLSKLERTRLKDMVIILGKTPRTVKRFLNIYRIIRSHPQIRYTDLTKEDAFLYVMFLLALGIGQHRLQAKNVFKALQDQKSVRQALSVLDEDLGKDLIDDIAGKSTISPVLDFKVEALYEGIIPFVSRFSFFSEQSLLEEETEE